MRCPREESVRFMDVIKPAWPPVARPTAASSILAPPSLGPASPLCTGIIPGFALGIKPPGSVTVSDLITVAYSDTIFALNCYTVTFTAPGNAVTLHGASESATGKLHFASWSGLSPEHRQYRRGPARPAIWCISKTLQGAGHRGSDQRRRCCPGPGPSPSPTTIL